jgi:uncharacterized protein with ParB-like and HNH nuclease domain
MLENTTETAEMTGEDMATIADLPLAESEDNSGEDNEENIEDDSFQDDTQAIVQYHISTSGADYDVEGLVKRLERGDIVIPSFQRNYVWSQPEASRFIESLLLGLPIPAIFLAREIETNKLLVIDGQQRLKTLQFFYSGIFNPKNPNSKRKFRLTKVQPEFENLTYQDLKDEHKRYLNDSLIHAMIIKQESIDGDNTGIYHIFDRLNSQGMTLTPQEIRTAVDHGPFINLIQTLNNYEPWRSIYGKKSNRLKDEELILRFFAFYYQRVSYQRPMREFLNKFSQQHRHASSEFLDQAKTVFTTVIDLIYESLGKEAFHPKNQVNTAVFDSVMVALAHRLETSPIPNLQDIQQAYESLVTDSDYLGLVSHSTSDEQNLAERFRLADEAFQSI